VGALACALLGACGGSGTAQPDPFWGPIDSSTIAFPPTPSISSNPCPAPFPACYYPQLAYAHGQPFYFYNFGATATSKLQATPTAPIPSSLVLTNVYTFLGSCMQGPGFDAQQDAYSQQMQYPVFSALPDAGAPLPALANVIPVSGVSNETCNDIKTAASVGTAASPGNYGAIAGVTQGVAIWPVVDNQAPFIASPTTNLYVAEQFGWYSSLQLQSVNAGMVPQDASGNLIPMDGVILDPPSVTGNPPQFAKVTDPKAIILPFVPGEPGFSPMVRLWDQPYGPTEPLGTYTDICHGCSAPNEINIDALTNTTKVPTNTIFIVTSAQ
jgi:hypothetical protein